MAKASDTRERLIDTAARLLHANSYGAVSVNDLCAHAGINKGSFYHFFPSKRDLALAAIEARWEVYKSGLLDVAFARDVPPLERLKRFLALAPRFHAHRAEDGTLLGCPFGNLALEAATQDAALRNRLRDIFDRFLTYFEDTLEEARATGEVGDLDVPETARRLLAYVQGAHVLAKTYNDPDMLSRLAAGGVLLARPGQESVQGP